VSALRTSTVLVVFTGARLPRKRPAETFLSLKRTFMLSHPKAIDQAKHAVYMLLLVCMFLIALVAWMGR